MKEQAFFWIRPGGYIRLKKGSNKAIKIGPIKTGGGMVHCGSIENKTKRVLKLSLVDRVGD